jgi:hypothetical protein
MPDKDAVRAHLRKVVEDSEPLLCMVWRRRVREDEFVVLADVRLDECRELIRQRWADQAMRRRLASGAHPYLPFLQPGQFIEAMLAGESAAQRQAALELRDFARHFARTGLAPLLVVARGWRWATCWAPPGSGTVVRPEVPV